MILSKCKPLKGAIAWVYTPSTAKVGTVETGCYQLTVIKMLVNGVALCHVTALHVINNGCSMKAVVFSMKWNGDYSDFSAQNSIKICQNIAWHHFSMLPSYFENLCHECTTYDHFLHWVLRLGGITFLHFDWLLSIHVVAQTWNMHTGVMRGLNHSLAMQCCASTQTIHCATMQLKKIFHSDESLLN